MRIPTEFEFKYVLSLEVANFYDHKALLKKSSDFLHIKQGYLAFSKGMTLRVRSATSNGKEKWFLTFKQKVGDRVIEIEKKIDDRDGNDLWDVCIGCVKKDRYIFEDQGLLWELDLFRKGGHLYFVQLEVELREGQPRPKEVPEFLKSFVIYEVPLTDDRFASKRLADIGYASQLYSLIEKGEINGKGV